VEEILEQAARLGRSLRDHESFRVLRAAEQAVLDAPESRNLADALGRVQGERREAAEAGRPPDPALDGRIEKLAAASAADPLLRDLWRAQQEFQALVNRVSATMLAELAPPASPPTAPRAPA